MRRFAAAAVIHTHTHIYEAKACDVMGNELSTFTEQRAYRTFLTSVVSQKTVF